MTPSRDSVEAQRLRRRRDGRGGCGGRNQWRDSGGRRRRYNYVIIDDRILRHVDRRRRCGLFSRRGGGGGDGAFRAGDDRTELTAKSQHVEAADRGTGHETTRQDERARRGVRHSFASFHR
jgi:hypothetical protein